MVMKASFVIPIIISILLGSFCGKLVFDQYQSKQAVFQENNTAYFLQQGVYSKEESLLKNTEKLDSKVVILEDGKYYVYIGITRNEETARKLKELYEAKGYSIYQKEQPINNYEFINNLEQYDILLANASSEEEMLSVMNTILASYEESVLEQ